LPGDFIAERPVNSVIQPAGLPIATPLIEVLRRLRESAQYTSDAFQQVLDDQLIHHSDAGSQYTSFAFQQELDDHGVLASIGSVGDAYDNAMAESFVDTFKTELISAQTASGAPAHSPSSRSSNGSPGSTTTACTRASATCPPAEFEQALSAPTVRVSPLRGSHP
jgi:transposase InsO family protein